MKSLVLLALLSASSAFAGYDPCKYQIQVVGIKGSLLQIAKEGFPDDADARNRRVSDARAELSGAIDNAIQACGDSSECRMELKQVADRGRKMQLAKESNPSDFEAHKRRLTEAVAALSDTVELAYQVCYEVAP